MNNSDFKIPSSVLALYVKIYCKKRKENKNKTSNVLVEATKSWLTLSKYEKHRFTTKYQKLKRDINKQFADQLKNAVPYLKKKVPVSRAVVETNSQTVESEKEYEEEIEENNVLDAVNQSDNIPNIEENKSQVTNHEEANNESVLDTEIENLSNGVTNERNEETYITPLSEPIPPKLLTGQQLFEMVNERSDDQTWTNLTKTEKRRYQNAVLTIKRNYLKDYKKYLEHLPSEKLFEHYKNNILSL